MEGKEEANDMKVILENICEEFEFVSANYYALQETKEGYELTAKDQPFVLLNDDELNQ